jgi:hypothetical protein
MNPIGWAGVVLIIGSMATLGTWTAWFRTRTWTPVDEVPISLAKGTHYSSPELPINVSDQYAVKIEADNKIHAAQLRCQLGAGSAQQLCDSPTSFKAHWVLSSAGKNVEEGSNASQALGGLNVGPATSSAYIAVFRLKRGHRYKFDVDVLSDTGNLNVTNPRLSVEEFGTLLEFDLVISGLLRVVCFAIAIIGVLLLIGSFYEQQRATSMQSLAGHVTVLQDADEDANSRD